MEASVEASVEVSEFSARFSDCLLNERYLNVIMKKQRCEKALEGLSSARSADMHFILAKKLKVSLQRGAAEAWWKPPRKPPWKRPNFQLFYLLEDDSEYLPPQYLLITEPTTAII